jgi:superfamily II DNA helicase RecQ
MCARLPASTSDLLRISGIGERRAADYGELFLQEIARFRASEPASKL